MAHGIDIEWYEEKYGCFILGLPTKGENPAGTL